MKRPAENCDDTPAPPKRPRFNYDTDFEHNSQQLQLLRISGDIEASHSSPAKNNPRHKSMSMSGYLSASILKKQPHGKWILSSSDDTATRPQFIVMLDPQLSEHLEDQGIPSVGDHIYLSIDAAMIECRTPSNESSGIILHYGSEIAFKWVHCVKRMEWNGKITAIDCDDTAVTEEEMPLVEIAAEEAQLALEHVQKITKANLTISSFYKMDRNVATVIGVVVSTQGVSQAKAGSKDPELSFKITDMSLCGQAHESLTVNCFTRRFPEWLPQISEGDVVILVDLKWMFFQSVRQGKGFSDRMRWAVIDHTTGLVRKPQLNRAPSHMYMDSIIGRDKIFSPFYTPDPEEVAISLVGAKAAKRIAAPSSCYC